MIDAAGELPLCEIGRLIIWATPAAPVPPPLHAIAANCDPLRDDPPHGTDIWPIGVTLVIGP